MRSTYQAVDVSPQPGVRNPVVLHGGESQQQEQRAQGVDGALVHDVLVGQFDPHGGRGQDDPDDHQIPRHPEGACGNGESVQSVLRRIDQALCQPHRERGLIVPSEITVYSRQQIGTETTLDKRNFRGSGAYSNNHRATQGRVQDLVTGCVVTPWECHCYLEKKKACA